MSYEGYIQCICKNGHRFNAPEDFSIRFGSSNEDVENTKSICPYCNARAALENSVDQTNGSEYGYIHDREWNTFLLEPEEKKICDCGFEHVMKHAVYRIPTKKEIQRSRTFRDEDDWNKIYWVPIDSLNWKYGDPLEEYK